MTPELHFALLPIINRHGEYKTHEITTLEYKYYVDFESEKHKEKFDSVFKLWSTQFLQ